MLTRTDYDILIFQAVRDPSVFKEFCSKTENTTFDPAIYYAHDFIAGELGRLWKTYSRHIGAASIRRHLLDKLEEASYDDGVKAEIRTFLDYIFTIPDGEIDPGVGLRILEKVIDRQVTERAREELNALIRSGGSISSALGRISSELHRKSVSSPQNCIITPFTNISEHMVHNEAHPFGISFLDRVLDGGASRHDMYGLLAPSGGGKTMLAVQLMTSWLKQEWQRRAILITFEQPLKGDIMNRLNVCATGVPIQEFKGRMYADLRPEVREKADRAAAAIGSRLAVVDFSTGDVGKRGPEDIKQAIVESGFLKDDGAPLLVIVDWLLPCLQRFLSYKGMSSSDKDSLRLGGCEMLENLKNFKNNHNMIMMINHQLSGAAAHASSAKKPDWTEAAEWKGFSWYTDLTFTVGKMSDEQVAHFVASKTRSIKPGDCLIKLKGEYCTFVDAEEEYMCSNGRIVPKVQRMEDLDAAPRAPRTYRSSTM